LVSKLPPTWVSSRIPAAVERVVLIAEKTPRIPVVRLAFGSNVSHTWNKVVAEWYGCTSAALIFIEFNFHIPRSSFVIPHCNEERRTRS